MKLRDVQVVSFSVCYRGFYKARLLPEVDHLQIVIKVVTDDGVLGLVP